MVSPPSSSSPLRFGALLFIGGNGGGCVRRVSYAEPPGLVSLSACERLPTYWFGCPPLHQNRGRCVRAPPGPYTGPSLVMRHSSSPPPPYDSDTPILQWSGPWSRRAGRSFLSMKLATMNPRLEFNMDNLPPKDMHQACGTMPLPVYPLEAGLSRAFPFSHQPQGHHPLQSVVSNGIEMPLNSSLHRSLTMPLPPLDGFANASSQLGTFWEDDLQSVVQMGFGQTQELGNTLKSVVHVFFYLVALWIYWNSRHNSSNFSSSSSLVQGQQ